MHRISVLGQSARPLLFGRIDERAGPSWHIGRRHVEDAEGDPVVVDWRAPVAVPFYQARIDDPQGLALRRQVMVERTTVISVADDLFEQHGGDAASTRLRGGDALLAELERARTGEMLDIVATIQAEQDDIIRAPLDLTLAVQGGPGTGKTAVGLHRAAYLLYNHPALANDGVLVLGPSRAFLRYIAQVLPSLGEEAVLQTTVSDIAPKAKVQTVDPPEVRTLKGDPRMAEVVARALHLRRQRVTEAVTVRARSARATFEPDEINALSERIASGSAPYKAGRTALRARLVSLARHKVRVTGSLDADQPWYERELTTSTGFGELLDHLWPSVSPAALVGELLGEVEVLRASASGVFEESEWRRLVRARAKGGATASWAIDDLALLDEAAFLINGRTRTYGHVVVDEAQDLTPMQFRMVARRAPSGSVTILGDLAQASGAWNYASWDEIVVHLGGSAPERRDELTLGYRAPGRVLDLAAKLLVAAAPSVTPTRSIRPGTRPPRMYRCRGRTVVGGERARGAFVGRRGLVGGSGRAARASRRRHHIGQASPTDGNPRARRNGQVGHRCLGRWCQGPRIRCGGRRRAGRNRRRRCPWPAAALRRDDPTDPAPESGARTAASRALDVLTDAPPCRRPIRRRRDAVSYDASSVHHR